MKSVLLLFLMLCILVGITLQGKVIQVQVVIPPRLLPYYEWLLSFPGIKHLPETPLQEHLPLYQTSNV